MVVVVDGLAASGGYIAAIAADHIVAQETSLVGSIGVLFQYPEFQRALKTLGIKVEEIKSSPLKAAPNGFEPTSPGGARGDRGDRHGFLCLVPRPGEDAPPARRRRRSNASPTGASSPAARASRSSSSTSSATSGRRSPGWPRRRTSIRRRRCATSGCATGSATCRSCTRPRSRSSKRSGWARSRGTSRSGARCRRSSGSTLTVCWPFGTLRLRTRPAERRPDGGMAAPMIKSELVQRIADAEPASLSARRREHRQRHPR